MKSKNTGILGAMLLKVTTLEPKGKTNQVNEKIDLDLKSWT
ncbi:MAG: hypothetical protein WBL49_01955 [Nitrososphaeraceae archaeon]